MMNIAYQIKGIGACNNMVANNLPVDPYPTQGVGSKGQNSTFSEYGHVAYQIKRNDTCSNMVANILPADPQLPPRYWGWG